MLYSVDAKIRGEFWLNDELTAIKKLVTSKIMKILGILPIMEEGF